MEFSIKKVRFDDFQADRIFISSITNLIRKIKESGYVDLDYDQHSGKDFLYLFDLLAHTSGIESTLRVLTFADSEFHHMCLPKVKLQPMEVSRTFFYSKMYDSFFLRSLKTV